MCTYEAFQQDAHLRLVHFAGCVILKKMKIMLFYMLIMNNKITFLKYLLEISRREIPRNISNEKNV